MPRWAIVLTVAPLVLCLGCVVVGVLVARRVFEDAVPKVQDNVSAEMTAALSGDVSRRIEASARAAGGIGEVDEVVLRASDLNVNTSQIPGEVGIETSPDGTHVYGVETQISSEGITLLFPGVTYSAVPILVDGRIELTQIEDSGNLLGFMFPDESFEEVIEAGIDDALRDHGLTPVSLMLRSGSMAIQVIPGACLGGPGGLGACDPATPIGGETE